MRMGHQWGFRKFDLDRWSNGGHAAFGRIRHPRWRSRGYPSQLSAIEAVNAGVDGYLTKPFRAIEPLMAAARAWNQK